MKKIIRLLVSLIMFIIFFLGSFTFIVIGTYLLPIITEDILLKKIELGMNLMLFQSLYSIGILGGALAIILFGLRLIGGKRCQKNNKMNYQMKKH